MWRGCREPHPRGRCVRAGSPRAQSRTNRLTPPFEVDAHGCRRQRTSGVEVLHECRCVIPQSRACPAHWQRVGSHRSNTDLPISNCKELAGRFDLHQVVHVEPTHRPDWILRRVQRELASTCAFWAASTRPRLRFANAPSRLVPSPNPLASCHRGRGYNDFMETDDKCLADSAQLFT